MTEQPPSPTRASAALVALVGLTGLASAMGVGRFAFTPLLPLMQQAGQMTLAQGGWLAVANYLGYLAGALACTAAALSPGRLARSGLLWVALLTLGMGWAGSWWQWLLLRFGAGVASACVLVGISAWSLPRLQQRPAVAGVVYSGVGIGIFAAGIVALAAAASGRGPDDAWVLLGVCSALIAAGGWRLLGRGDGQGIERGTCLAPIGREGWRLIVAYAAFGFGYIIPATFLPALARQLAPDPALFGWTWPIFGIAGAASTLIVSRLASRMSPRRLWVLAQGVMGIGVMAPALHESLPVLMFSALCVGGTLIVATMAALQEGRRVAGPAGAPRLMGALTAAFAVGQLAGPFTVTLARDAGLAVPSIVAASVLWLGLLALRGPESSLSVDIKRGERP
ncbi:MAG TPA: YbfB/YjiJ family MFS transporter [Burkholderiaceae bacterium]|nr:YbfB/YjiJ family MFS transporter [Burkholderiaceae bacterium]